MSNPVRLLQNASEIYLLVQRESDGKLSLVNARNIASELLFEHSSLEREGVEVKLLHLQLSDKGFGIVRPARENEIHTERRFDPNMKSLLGTFKRPSFKVEKRNDLSKKS